MNSYRINVRFNLEDDAERKAAEYLQKLYCKEKKSRNRFIVEAVTAYIERIAEKDTESLLQSIREIFREEIQDISVAALTERKTTVADTELTEQEQAENALSVLSDLEMFGRAKVIGFWLILIFQHKILCHYGSTKTQLICKDNHAVRDIPRTADIAEKGMSHTVTSRELVYQVPIQNRHFFLFHL